MTSYTTCHLAGCLFAGIIHTVRVVNACVLKKKKPKDKPVPTEETGVEADATADAGDDTAAQAQSNGADEDAEMTYKDMLDRAYRAIKENNPDITEKKRYVLAPPQIMRVGTTRTCWSNFADICKGWVPLTSTCCCCLRCFDD